MSCTGISSISSTPSCRSSNRSTCGPAAVTSFSTSIGESHQNRPFWPPHARRWVRQVTPDGTFAFYAEGPDKIEAVVRVAMPHEPKEVTIDGHPLPAPCAGLACRIEHAAPPLPQLGPGAQAVDPLSAGRE